MLNINLSRISPDLLCWKTLVRPRCVGGRIERMKVKEDSSFTTSQRHGVTARDTWQQHKTWHVTTVYRILRGADDCISSAPSHQLVNRVEGSRVRGYLYTLPLIYLTSLWCCLLLKLGHLSAKKYHFQHADNLLKCLKACLLTTGSLDWTEKVWHHLTDAIRSGAADTRWSTHTLQSHFAQLWSFILSWSLNRR